MLAAVYLWLLRRRQTACRQCSHDRGSHAPYIPGDDRPGYCMACECYQYKPERPWALALAFLRERPAPVQPQVLRQQPVVYPVRDPVGYDDKTEFGLRVAPWVRDDWEAGR